MDDIYVAGEPAEQLKNVQSRVRNIEAIVTRLAEQRHVAGDYTVTEFAALVGRSEYTVREWCRLTRINAKKVAGARRGDKEEWRIPRSELERYRNEGLTWASPTALFFNEKRHPTFQNDCYQHSFRKRMP